MAILISASQLPEHLRPRVQAAVDDWRTSVLAIARVHAKASSRKRRPVARAEPRQSAHAPQPTAQRRAPSWYLDQPPTPSWRL